MSRVPVLLRLALGGVCALSLAGCISLLPKTKPATLYRFGSPPPGAEAPPTQETAEVGVVRAGGLFQRESGGDRLLTVTGGRVAYVADVRWATAAQVLFDQALLAAFDNDPGPIRLMSRGEPGTAKFVLRVDVRNFEARYDRGAEAAPEVLVRLRAVMVRTDRSQSVEHILESRVRAGDNRVGPIVDAYDRAVADVLGRLVTWTNTQAAAAPAA